MTEAQFYKKLPENKVQCELCNHHCIIASGKRGICGVRENQKGSLYSLVYGKIIAANIDPIEKKPLFHFQPGSISLSIATIGCNFRCLHCQNADISQASKEGYFFDKAEIPGKNYTPQQIIDEALANNCQSISYTYTEPTIFCEFALDCMKLAKINNLKNNWVTNGYTTPKALETIKPYLDAVNVDLKFFTEGNYQKICGAKLQPVLDNLIWYKKNKIWLEVTTLIIPTLNDSEKELRQIAEFIKNKLGDNTPWHVSAFFPTYKLTELPPTPLETIRKAWQIGKEMRLKYVYGGNVIDSNIENTYCPKCNEVVIKRMGYSIKRLDKNGNCRKCGEKLDIID